MIRNYICMPTFLPFRLSDFSKNCCKLTDTKTKVVWDGTFTLKNKDACTGLLFIFKTYAPQYLSTACEKSKYILHEIEVEKTSATKPQMKPELAQMSFLLHIFFSHLFLLGWFLYLHKNWQIIPYGLKNILTS